MEPKGVRPEAVTFDLTSSMVVKRVPLKLRRIFNQKSWIFPIEKKKIATMEDIKLNVTAFTVGKIPNNLHIIFISASDEKNITFPRSLLVYRVSTKAPVEGFFLFLFFFNREQPRVTQISL